MTHAVAEPQVSLSRTDEPETIRFNIHEGWPDRLHALTGILPDAPAWAHVSRYTFDFNLPMEEWAQMDTDQDASYYGHWASPFERAIISYVEGDIEYRSFPTEEEWAEAVRGWVLWAKDAGCFSGIDGMCKEPMIEAFRRLGLGEFLH